MSEESPGRPGTAAFVAALNVERNAKAGFGIGTVLALGLLALVVRSAEVAQYSVVYYAGLAFVLAVGTGLLLTLVFTLGSLYRRVREMDAESGAESEVEDADETDVGP